MQFLYYFQDLSSHRAFDVHPSRNIFFLLIFSSFSLSVLRYLQTKYFPFQNIFLHFLLCFSSQQTNIVFQIIGPFPSQLFFIQTKKYFSSANNCFLLLRTKYFPSLNIFSFCFSSHLNSKVFFSPFPSLFFSPPYHHSPYQVPPSLHSYFRPKTNNKKSLASESRINSRTCIGHSVLSYVVCHVSKSIARIANAVQVTV